LLTYARRPVPPGSREPAFLLMHGTADDNVYFLNSMKLVDALEQSGHTFTFLPFIGQTHQSLFTRNLAEETEFWHLIAHDAQTV
jgi:dipeptidyl-peptidase-4